MSFESLILGLLSCPDVVVLGYVFALAVPTVITTGFDVAFVEPILMQQYPFRTRGHRKIKLRKDILQMRSWIDIRRVSDHVVNILWP